MKNLHVILFGVILILAVASGVAVKMLPTHEGLDIRGGMRVVLGAKTQKPLSTEDLNKLTEIMNARVNSLGVSEAQVFPKGGNQLVLELPGIQNKDEALSMIQSTAQMEFRSIPQLDNGTWTAQEQDDAKGGRSNYARIVDQSGKPVPQEVLDELVFKTDPILKGSDLKNNARANIANGDPVVDFEFKDDAKGTFEDFTRTHLHKALAIFLDKQLISAPSIDGVIPGKGIIKGKFTAEYAKGLADLLNAGALPVPLEQLQVQNVEATLGRSAVQQTTLAGMIGLGLVLLFMIAVYRLPGVLADIALALYTLFSLAAFKLIPGFTLTVPGIAGFILSIGMAVDANILIFERFKEERKAGKSLRAAIEAGFHRAFSAIRDSNVCTLITCGILYYFGTGQVRGFALTLAVGVAISMFTAITCSRTFLLLLSGARWAQNDGLYGLNVGFHPRLGVTKRMAFWFGLSGLIILPGLVFWGMGGIKKSVEFTGGNEFTASYTKPTTIEDVTRALSTVGVKGERVLLAEGGAKAYVTTQALTQDKKIQVRQAITNMGGAVEAESAVSGSISSELTTNAILSVLVASLMIILYLAIRFSIPSFAEGLKFGTCAVVALLHDVAVVWGAFAILGYFLNWQIDSLFVTAMLTVIGFSVHDTIVIFDRIRENLLHREKGEDFAHVTDRSIEQTFARSVNTSGTVVLTLAALLVLGGSVIKLFVAALLIGVISGTYSSIFNASPLLVLWKRLGGEPALATAGGAPAPRVTPRPAAPRAGEPMASVPASGDGAAADGLLAGDATKRVKPKRRQRRM